MVNKTRGQTVVICKELLSRAFSPFYKELRTNLPYHHLPKLE